eukprot:scaffold1638_cov258-Pinguiococcus_pyrenoidosus.AAC.91
MHVQRRRRTIFFKVGLRAAQRQGESIVLQLMKGMQGGAREVLRAVLRLRQNSDSVAFNATLQHVEVVFRFGGCRGRLR